MADLLLNGVVFRDYKIEPWDHQVASGYAVVLGDQILGIFELRENADIFVLALTARDNLEKSLEQASVKE